MVVATKPRARPLVRLTSDDVGRTHGLIHQVGEEQVRMPKVAAERRETGLGRVKTGADLAHRWRGRSWKVGSGETTADWVESAKVSSSPAQTM